MCQVPPLCHVNASCTTIHKPVVEKNCSCLNGFHGDGYVCDPVNPCQADNGGCPKESTVCVMDAPGQVNNVFNPYLMNGFSILYHLDESTFIFRGIRSDF